MSAHSHKGFHIPWHEILLFHCFVIYPVCGLIFIYSIGAMVLLGDWQLFVVASIVFAFCALLMTVLSILAE